MKKLIATLSVLLLMILLSSCREITVSTTINKDGSFTRTIKITGDSSDVFRRDLPYPVDESWTMTVKRDPVDSALFVTWTKNFSSSRALNTEIKNDTGWWKNIDREITIDKKFGFFYSYLSYKEQISAANPFNALDYSDFLTDDDLRWLTNEKSPLNDADTVKIDDAEEKAMEFLGKSITEEFIQLLAQGIEELNDPLCSPQVAHKYYDSIQSWVFNWEFDKPFLLIDSIAGWSGNSCLSTLKEKKPHLFDKYMSKAQLLTRFIEMENYDIQVEMPGIITETNSASITGNKVSWTVESFSFLVTDYNMYVESRVVNYWMFILSGLILLILMATLIIKSFKSK